MQQTTSTSKNAFFQALGPGLIMAAAAIGVSHLVQSTRAGAGYGFTLIWAVLLANVFKYPFLEFGPRYAIATRQSVIQGYRKLGKWAIWVFALFTCGTMFVVQAAVTVVTASLAAELTGLTLTPLLWSALILGICILILYAGQYSALDRAVKVIIVVLSVSTLVAVIAAATRTNVSALPSAPSIWTVGGVSFLIALMGWMPIPIDGAAWHSMWSLQRMKQTGVCPSMKDCLTDFNIGYIGAGVLAIGFLSLGALVMFGAGEEFASGGSGFANQLVSLYTATMGDWAYWIIIICAFTTMFSTTLTVTDAYPRVTEELLKPIIPSHWDGPGLYRSLLVLISTGSLIVMAIAGSAFTLLVDLATTLSFLTAPVLAYLNYKLVMDAHFPEAYTPPRWLQWLSVSGLLFLTGFALVYVYWNIRFG